MGRLFIESKKGTRVYKCKTCKVDTASPNDVVSKDFQGRFGRAYLIRDLVNIFLGPREERHLTSGLHLVNDIYCSSCQQILGWRYEKAYEESQKYKEGMYILEKERMLKQGCSSSMRLDPLLSTVLIDDLNWAMCCIAIKEGSASSKNGRSLKGSDQTIIPYLGVEVDLYCPHENDLKTSTLSLIFAIQGWIRVFKTTTQCRYFTSSVWDILK
ncbi:hypothetical protein ACFE04_000995 [Oxalis oulophora]